MNIQEPIKNTSQYLYFVEIRDYPVLHCNRENITSIVVNYTMKLNIISASVDECLNYVRDYIESEILFIKEKHGLSPKEKYRITNCSNVSNVDVLIPVKPFVPFIV